MLLATVFTTGLSVETALLTAVNAVIVALAAMGACDLTFAKAGKESGRKRTPEAAENSCSRGTL